METGKVNYSPDYKSEKFSDFFNKQMENPEFREAYLKVDAEEDSKLKAALEREWKIRELERAVVEAAKAWVSKRGEHVLHHTARQCSTCSAERGFYSATYALIDFDSQHAIEPK